MIEIIIADPITIILDGLKALLENENNLNVIGTAKNETQLLQQLQIKQPNLILFDVGALNESDVQNISKIQSLYPSVKLLLFITYPKLKHIKKALRYGVNGCLLKDISKSELLEAITTIIGGKNYFDQRISNIIMQNHYINTKPASSLLTTREKQITKLISNSMSTQEISNELSISSLTVETHRKNIFAKLGISKVAALVRYAIKEGLVD